MNNELKDIKQKFIYDMGTNKDLCKELRRLERMKIHVYQDTVRLLFVGILGFITFLLYL